MTSWRSSLLVILCAKLAAAQVVASTVRGVAYDSLHAMPLAGAMVSLVGRATPVFADSDGRFRFDSVPRGLRTFVVHHDSLDASGFSSLRTRVEVLDGDATITAALPSFGTIWSLACKGQRANDRALIYGTVREADGRVSTRGAVIDIAWLDLSVGRRNNLSQNWLHRFTNADSVSGSFAVCGVPANVVVHLTATADSVGSGIVDLLPSDVRVTRRDLVVAKLMGQTIDEGGTIFGQLRDSSGLVYDGARVRVDGAAEVRSDINGYFTVSGIPAGTRQLEILSLGMMPIYMPIDVLARDTMHMALTLRRVTTLDLVRVTATRRNASLLTTFKEHKASAGGYFRDSVALGVTESLAAMLSIFPALRVHRAPGGKLALKLNNDRGQECDAEVWIDGVRQTDTFLLEQFKPKEFAIGELFPRKLLVPSEYAGEQECGVLAVWTKRAIRPIL